MKHPGCMIGGIDCSAGLKAANIVQVLSLPGALPDVMVMVAGEIEDVLVKKRLTILGKDEFNEALKDHRGLIDIGQSHFEDITVKDQCGLFRAFVARNNLPQAAHQLAQ